MEARTLPAVLLSIALSSAAFSLPAQSSADLRFSAASLKPLPPPPPAPPGEEIVSERVVRTNGAGQIDPSRIHSISTLRELLAEAYQVKEAQIAGPAWIATDRFVVDATMPPETTQEQRYEMLRNLLTDRFRLATHRETRELPAYSLVLAREGIKINESTAQAADVRVVATAGHIEIHAHGATMQDLAAHLARQLDRPITDNTAATARYDFDFAFSPDAVQDLPDVFGALPSLGLKLEAKKTPVNMIVIDRADHTPAAN